MKTKQVIESVKKSAIRHTTAGIVIALLLSLIIKSESMGIVEQCILYVVLLALLNWGFEIYSNNKKSKKGKKINTIEQIIGSTISASIGGLIGCLIGNIF